MAGTVTALRFQKRQKDRVNVFLDGEYAFSLPGVEAARLQIGQHLTDQEIADLQRLGLRSKAYDRALRFLALRPRSSWEVRRNLGQYRRKEERLKDEDVEWVIARLTQQGYLDDQEFARFWVEQRARFKPMAPRALRYELRQKGVDEATIQAVLSAREQNPEAAALEAARSRLARWQGLDQEAFRKKMVAFLQRRGFDWDAIRGALEQLAQERGSNDSSNDSPEEM